MPNTAKGYKYKPGTHWTQRPENRDKLIAAVSGPRKKRGRPRKKKQYVATREFLSKAEGIVAREVKKHRKAKPHVTKETTIVLNGWAITLGHNSVKIEQS